MAILPIPKPPESLVILAVAPEPITKAYGDPPKERYWWPVQRWTKDGQLAKSEVELIQCEIATQQDTYTSGCRKCFGSKVCPTCDDFQFSGCECDLCNGDCPDCGGNGQCNLCG